MFYWLKLLLDVIEVAFKMMRILWSIGDVPA